ncbi:MAG: class I SAM-dependent methyltransferase [Nocardioidaceae bacterium]
MSEQYFSAEPGSIDRRRDVTASVWGQELRLQSSSGVFSDGRVDIGTAVLFRATGPQAATGTYLDLGCGYGVIACALAVAVPAASIWAVDVNERALRVCRDNAAGLGAADRVWMALPGEVPADVVFDEIWSNPPIRIGKPALHQVLRAWLPRLAPGGRAVFVVGKNLGADSLQRWIIEQGFACHRLASAKGFRVLEARPLRAAE